MKIAYFDCFSGISGDMIVGALIDVGLDVNFLSSELKKLNLKNYKINSKRIVKNGIYATKFDVVIEKSNEESNINDINKIISKSRLNNGIKNKIKKIFLRIAEAESKVHNIPIDKIHFHEIGAADTIIDVAGAVIGMEKLGIEKVYCSKINVGNGFVEFSHGKFPVPAPATAEILKGIPVYSTDSNAELTTPTGAAIISVLAEKFGEMPEMNAEKIGYGAGEKELKQPNVLRVFIGKFDEIINIIETNIDDMNPQIYEYVIDKLLENGALDAYLASIIMKKGRPGIKLSVLAKPENADKLCNIIFEETTSIGVRIRSEKRRILDREIREAETKYGKIRVKVSKLNGKILNAAPEYEDCKRAAEKHNVPLKRIYEEMRYIAASFTKNRRH